MKAKLLSEAALEKSLAAKLEELLRSVSWLQDWQVQPAGGARGVAFDLLATLPLPGGGAAALCVDCRREMRPGVFVTLADRTFSPAGRPKAVVRVLALPWVSPRVAELCSERGWSWFDLAGNCSLDVPGLLHLRHTGNPPVHERPRPAANLGTPAAGRVVRALLVPEHGGRRWTQRELRERCRPEVSLGLVNKVVRHLIEEAFVAAGPDGGFALSDPVRLLVAWRDAYRFERHEQRTYFTLLQGRKLDEALAGLGLRTGGLAAYAAFSAAERQAPHVRQPQTWLYVREADIRLFEELAEARRVDSGENIVVLLPDDEGVFHPGGGATAHDGRLGCTNPVQTYVDLCHSGGRGEEAAEALLDQLLRPAWRERGLKA